MSELTIFEYEETKLRTVEVDGETFWVAKDICDVLDIKNSRQAVDQLDEDEKGVCKTYTLGGYQDLTVINESGLYSLIIRSNKPEAKKFKKWITSEVIPSIRRTGQYELVSKVQELEQSILEDRRTLKTVMEFGCKIITMQENIKNKPVLGEKLFNSRSFNVTVSRPNKEDL